MNFQDLELIHIEYSLRKIPNIRVLRITDTYTLDEMADLILKNHVELNTLEILIAYDTEWETIETIQQKLPKVEIKLLRMEANGTLKSRTFVPENNYN